MSVQGEPRIRSRFSDFVDPEFGIVGHVQELLREPGAPSFFHFGSRACNTSAFSQYRNFRDAGGASANRDTALLKAVGEAVERYCSALYCSDRLTLCAYRDIQADAVRPSDWALFSDSQYSSDGFPWKRFQDDTLVRWCPAIDVESRRQTLVPASRVYMPYFFDEGIGEVAIDQPISTGLACHESLERALVAGACEVIERDAIMLCWLTKYVPRRIDHKSLGEQNRDLVRRFQDAKFIVDVFAITMDHGIPVCIATIRGDIPSLPGLVVAGACSLDPDEAVRKSLEELAHTNLQCRLLQRRLGALTASSPDFPEVRDQAGHLRFYLDPRNVKCASYLFESSDKVDFREIESPKTGTPAGDLEVLCKRITGTGNRILAVDLTTPDVQEIGLFVVRAMIPGFHPLHLGHGNRSLGGNRIRSALMRVGNREGDQWLRVNPYPHPYP
jgi:ribosomal protein S12 methylthiotransferase accessory factor